MASYPPLKLSHLRDIGWTEWDPIGILSEGESWEHHPAADEYDGYLLEVASRLRRDWSVADASDYLIWAASEHMGLGVASAAARASAEATAKAIQAYLETLAAGS
jgi:hypothetical protein